MKLSQYLEEAEAARKHQPHIGTCPDCPEILCVICKSTGSVAITGMVCEEGEFDLDQPSVIPCPACVYLKS